MEPKFVNHWGKWVSSEEPVTGVISVHNINWEFMDEICLTCEEFFRDFEKNICPDCGGKLIEDDEEQKTCEECNSSPYPESVECDSQHDKIFGDWKFDTVSGKYEVDKDGEFAAILRESEIQVVWSKTIAKNKQLCSPCFPGQVDLDSDGGDFQGYMLPDYLIYKEEVETWKCPDCGTDCSAVTCYGKETE